jgi:hypothetical protein
MFVDHAQADRNNNRQSKGTQKGYRAFDHQEQSGFNAFPQDRF